MAVTTTSPSGVLRSVIPARLDQLKWTSFHTRLVLALGVAWVLDGLEITIASSISGVLGKPTRTCLPPPSAPSERSTSSAKVVIDEMIPARYRGRVDIAVNGTWVGSIHGTLGALLFLHTLPESLGWRLGILVGPALALVILYVRRNLPESPRWLLMHGKVDEAERNIAEIEELAGKSGHQPAAVDNSRAIVIMPTTASMGAVLRVLFVDLWRRSALGASLMITQSFLYNAIFFTYTPGV